MTGPITFSAGQTRRQVGWIDLGETARRVAASARRRSPPLPVSAEAAQPLGMALHELLTNAAGYGALSNDAGRVAITWGMSEDRARGTYFHLSWVEMGGPPVSAPARHGFGTTIVEQIPRVQLEAEVAHDYARAGVSWRLVCRAEKVLEFHQTP